MKNPIKLSLLQSLPMKAISGGMVITVGLFLFAGWHVWKSHTDYKTILLRDLLLQTHVESLNKGPVLTSLARSAVRSGNQDAMESYNVVAAELTAAVEGIRDVSKSLEMQATVEHLEGLNTRLMSIEREALKVMASGYRERASNMLYDDEYNRYLKEFDEILGLMQQVAKKRLETDALAMRRRVVLSFMAICACIPILLSVWLVVLKMVRRHLQERRVLEEQLREMSLQDELTDLYNRRGFLTLADQQRKVSNRMLSSMFMLFCDLDGLKKINDDLGHAEGDRAIMEMGEILRNTFRESDIIARIGGDEFVILGFETDPNTAMDLIRRLDENMRFFNTTSGAPFRLSISIGRTTYDPESPVPLEDLVSRADAMMYEQKRRRRLLAAPQSRG